MSLDDLRRRIDELDARILELLLERGRLASTVGELKAEGDAPVYAPDREAELMRDLLDRHLEPLDEEAVSAVFREIVSACRGLQRLPRVAYLGPEHTFTHLAARQRFGHRADFLPEDSIFDIFDAAERGQADFGVVPIQNSIEGVVGQTLDSLLETPLRICAEVYVQINHYLAALDDIPAVTRVCSHPQVLAQCRVWLRENLPGVEQVPSSSSGAAAADAAEDPAVAAICTREAAEANGLRVLAEKIEDVADNRTRFFIIGDLDVSPTGRDKTSLVFSTPHRAGALHRALGAFAQHTINLTMIQSRPARAKLWEYVFFVDFEGHRQDPGPTAALDQLSEWCLLLKVLGSYPAEPA
ncbi:MAG: prephenate dehydratase [Armatimonadota bacterium]|nr:prephenate dehydratase [Armatimonadota bacterium]